MTKVMGILSLVVCSTAFAKGGAGDADAKVTAEVKPIIEKFFEAFTKADSTAMKAEIADDMWGAYDVDMAQQPAAWANKAELGKFFDEAAGMMKKMGANMTWKTTKFDCKGSTTLAVCMLEGDQTFAMGKMPPMAMKARGTEVFAKEKGAWKWVHHHGSMARDEMPGKTMAANAKAAGGWMDAPPDMPGVKMIPMWMDAANMWSSMIMKATQEWKQPRHIHPYPMTFAVLEGQIMTTGPDGKMTTYGPGSVFYRAANEPHETTIKPGFVGFMVGSGPFMQINVDAAGKPVQQAAK